MSFPGVGTSGRGGHKGKGEYVDYILYSYMKIQQ
jgi:hypothetical protein